jgi:hypothetical protein
MSALYGESNHQLMATRATENHKHNAHRKNLLFEIFLSLSASVRLIGYSPKLLVPQPTFGQVNESNGYCAFAM